MSGGMIYISIAIICWIIMLVCLDYYKEELGVRDTSDVIGANFCVFLLTLISPILLPFVIVYLFVFCCSRLIKKILDSNKMLMKNKDE